MKIGEHLEKMVKSLVGGYSYIEYKGHHRVSNLIAAHHLSPKTFTGSAVVRHMDGNRGNDAVGNLKWEPKDVEVEDQRAREADRRPLGQLSRRGAGNRPLGVWKCA